MPAMQQLSHRVSVAAAARLVAITSTFQPPDWRLLAPSQPAGNADDLEHEASIFNEALINQSLS